MSYETNPIQNRIKINKGWKNPYLPIKTLNYPRDISLWFKVYLLLKVFLNLKKIQLISYEIRFDQQNKKILYLRINKKGTQRKKRKKKKSVLNQMLNKVKTPLLKTKNTGAIFFLYKDLIALKNMSFWNKNEMHKKVLSKFWLTKPKSTTWLTSMKKIMVLRQFSTKTRAYLKKNKKYIPIQNIKIKFYTSKQKQILTLISRLKKKNLVLSLKLFTLIQQKKANVLQSLIKNLQKDIFKNQIQIRKINKFYKFFTLSTRNALLIKKNSIYSKHIGFSFMQRHKFNLFWKTLKNKFNSLTQARFLRQELPLVLLNINKDVFKFTAKYNWSFLKKDVLVKKISHLNFLVSQIIKTNCLLKNYFLFRNWNFKTQIDKHRYKQITNNNSLVSPFEIKYFLQNRLKKSEKNFLKKRKLFYNIALLLLLRKKKKKRKVKLNRFRKKLRAFRKKIKFRRKVNAFGKYQTFWEEKKGFQLKKVNKHLQKNQNTNYYKYRLPYRKMYFDFLKVITNLRLKYLVQDFVQKYFSVQVEAKIVHILNAHKNQNFFRLVFPLWKKKKNQLIKKKRWNIWNQKQIFLTSQLKLVTTSKNQVKHKVTKKKDIKILNKRELLLMAEKKIVKRRMSNYFKRNKGSKDFRYIYKYFIPTLIEFSRSFDPQLLADLLSKVIRKAKKQTWMLKTIKELLQAIQLPRGVGYKIVLTGRINSKKKSRLIYITRNQITLQIFSNPMNFAYSQAEARIGTFGVKIWVYFKKNQKNEENNRTTAKYQI